METTEWELLDDASVFGGPGLQATTAGATLGERQIVVGIDESTSRGERIRPGVWISDGCRAWRRVAAGRIETHHPALPEADLVMQDVAVASDGTVLAVGHARQADASSPAVWRSTDGGERWQLAIEDFPRNGSLMAVSRAGEHVVAVGSSDGALTAWSSEDGHRWQVTDMPGTGAPVDLLAVADRLLVTTATDAGGQVWSWGLDEGAERAVSVDLPAGLRPAGLDVSPGGERFVLVGTVSTDDGGGRPSVLSSADGREWKEARRETLAVGDATLHDVAITAGRLILVGELDLRSAIWTSAGLGYEPQRVPLRLMPYNAVAEWILDGHLGTSVFGGAHRETQLWRRTTNLDWNCWIDAGSAEPGEQ